MTLRLAVVGKGGVGKTTIAGTLARLLARRGRRVLALDLDPNPGMSWTLGMPLIDDGLPELIAEHDGGTAPPNAWHLLEGVRPGAALEQFAMPAPDGVSYLSPGKIFGPAFLDNSSVFGVREIVRGLGPDWDVVADIDAATAVSCGRHLQFAEHLLLVQTAQPASALTVRRLQDLLHGWQLDVIFSMTGAEQDPGGLRPMATIPFDESVREADRRGVSLLDTFPDAPVIGVLDELAERLTAADAAPRP